MRRSTECLHCVHVFDDKWYKENTRQCKAEGGICKQTCAVDEEDTGSCCRNSNRCCQPPTCIDTLQYAQCKAKNGDIKPVCDVNEQDTGIGPFCNTNRCCEPPTCIVSVDCNCKSSTDTCRPDTEYQDNAGNCSGSNRCYKPCCHNYVLTIVEEGSKVMLNFTFFELEDGGYSDTVKHYNTYIKQLDYKSKYYSFNSCRM
ncbi:unnamed protein product [Mytilus edulis]|uniref:Uncharacterized protein n=1 Tax=Mytilus edulis TaxID=6550 RepID=A0A8S3R8V1_MYTED|nr:unnamed protein product [Mytilus edulis]